jgi:vancomycin resistance protein YoaR
MGALFSSIVLAKKPATIEQLQNCKTLIPWKPQDVIAFQKNGESKDGVLTFSSYVVLDQPPKEKDADKNAKELEKFKAKYVKKGTVPFKVFVDMELLQKKDNKKVKFLKAKTDIYVLNETTKKLVLKDKVDNLKLCAS